MIIECIHGTLEYIKKKLKTIKPENVVHFNSLQILRFDFNLLIL